MARDMCCCAGRSKPSLYTNATSRFITIPLHVLFIQNAGRIMRALFEICLKKGWPIMASRLLNLCKTVDKRLWGFETPLRQFPILSAEILSKIEAKKLKIDKLREMDSKEIGLY